MTALANTRTIPEALPDSAAKLRTAWPRRGSTGRADRASQS